jgi:hypothetical protein
MQKSRLKASTTHTRSARKVEYVAAIRYPDGTRDLFHIRNADSIDEARQLVVSEVGEVLVVMVAARH